MCCLPCQHLLCRSIWGVAFEFGERRSSFQTLALAGLSGHFALKHRAKWRSAFSNHSVHVAFRQWCDRWNVAPAGNCLALAQSLPCAKPLFLGLAGRAGATRFQVLFHLRRADLSAISVTIGGQVRPTGRRRRLADKSALRVVAVTIGGHVRPTGLCRR